MYREVLPIVNRNLTQFPSRFSQVTFLFWSSSLVSSTDLSDSTLLLLWSVHCFLTGCTCALPFDPDYSFLLQAHFVAPTQKCPSVLTQAAHCGIFYFRAYLRSPHNDSKPTPFACSPEWFKSRASLRRKGTISCNEYSQRQRGISTLDATMSSCLTIKVHLPLKHHTRRSSCSPKQLNYLYLPTRTRNQKLQTRNVQSAIQQPASASVLQRRSTNLGSP